jgi:RHS repeat-associated protein
MTDSTFPLPNGPLLLTGEIDCLCTTIGVEQIADDECCPCVEFVCEGIDQDTGDGLVDLWDGGVHLTTTELRVLGRGFDWAFQLSYRTGIEFDGPVGRSWEHNYNRRLHVEADGAVTRMDGYGRADRYERSGAAYVAPRGFFTRFVRNPDGTFFEQDKHRATVHYARPDSDGMARMTELRGRNGNRMRFRYDGHGRLSQVVDTLGRAIDYRYDGARLVEVEDFTGRRVRLGYDGGNLASVTSPAVVGTSTGDELPDGVTTLYRYAPSGDDAHWSTNLAEVVAPAEAAVGGPPRVCIDYESDPESPFAGRVTALVLGGTNATGIPAGGTIRYRYRTLAQAEEGDLETATSETAVTDRNGNETEYRFNRLGSIVRVRALRRGTADGETWETRLRFDEDGLLTQRVMPEGNAVEYVYDRNNSDRLQQGNVLAEIRRPDARRGGAQEALVTTFTYEPLYGRRRSITDPRGNDPASAPEPEEAERDPYTTRFVYDYQEGRERSRLARRIGVSVRELDRLLRAAGVELGLGDVNGDGRTNQVAGNVVRVSRPAVRLPDGSALVEVERGREQPSDDTHAYDDQGQRTMTRDPEGNMTLFEYYPEHSPGRGRARRGSAPAGYLRRRISDARRASGRNSGTDPPPVALAERWIYDTRGNVVREIDRRGVATDFEFDALDRLVQTVRAADVRDALRNRSEPSWPARPDRRLPETSGMTAFAHRTRFFYDANGNVVRREAENRDSPNAQAVCPWISLARRYEMLDQLVEERQQLGRGPGEVAVTAFRYDRNGNRVLELTPVANLADDDPERQAANVVSYAFDERDLEVAVTRGGVGDDVRTSVANADVPELAELPPAPAGASERRVYDGSCNVVEGIARGESEGTGMLFLYDGFDRLVSAVDPAGGQSFVEYDAAGNVVAESRFAPTGGPTPDGRGAATTTQPLGLEDLRQPLLARDEHRYDERGRRFETSSRLFAYADVAFRRPSPLRDGPAGVADDGWVTTRFDLDRKGRAVATVLDNGATTARRFDGLDREIVTIDAAGNEVHTRYDGNGNVVAQREVDVRSQGASAGEDASLREEYVTLDVYDALNRRIRSTDPVGQTVRFRYDSHDRLVQVTDPRHGTLARDPLGISPVRINRPGNAVEILYDGGDRELAEIRWLRRGGEGGGQLERTETFPDGAVVTCLGWDANGRLTTIADGSRLRRSTLVSTIRPADAAAVLTRCTYDNEDRVVQERNADGSGRTVTYAADGTIASATDAAGSVVTLAYDALRRVTRLDVARGPGVVGTTSQTFEWDGMSRMTRSVDDNGSSDPAEWAEVVNAYDSLGRPLEEVQNGHVVASTWLGVGHRSSLAYPNGRIVQREVDLLGRSVAIRDRDGAADIATFAYVGPRRVLGRGYANGVRRTFSYDGARRVGEIRDARPDGSVVVAFDHLYDRADNRRAEKKLHETRFSELYDHDSLGRLVDFRRGTIGRDGRAISRRSPSGLQRQTWELDSRDNWARTETIADGARSSEEREHGSFNALLTRRAERITRLGYDANGSQTTNGPLQFRYDVLNRLREVRRRGRVVARYSYDVFNRRVRKVVRPGRPAEETTVFLYDRWRTIEERDGGGRPLRQYVYGSYLDELLVADELGPEGRLRRLFYHQNALFSTFALTDEHGDVVEGYRYDPYGRPTVLVPRADGTVFGPGAATSDRGPSEVGNAFLFTGHRRDEESGLYYLRNRYLDPETGRFLTRDPSGYANGANLYAYVRCRPTNYLDPVGRDGIEVGFIGSVQFCIDFCTGDYRILGWLWAGAGYRIEKWDIWIGPSGFYDKTFLKGNAQGLKLLPCGECDPCCTSEPDGLSLSPIGVFKNLKKGTRTVTKFFGIEFGVLLVVESSCRGTIEIIALANLLDFLGPLGIVTKVVDAAKKLGLDVEFKAGIVGSFSIAICIAKGGGVTAPKAEGCLGGFVEVGVGLSKRAQERGGP